MQSAFLKHLFDLPKALFAKEHLLTNEECWNTKDPPFDGLFGVVDYSLFNRWVLRFSDQKLSIETCLCQNHCNRSGITDIEPLLPDRRRQHLD